MDRYFKFAVLRLSASAPRDERLNVGIAVYKQDRWDVHLPRSLAKLNALSMALDVDSIRAAAEDLNELDTRLSARDASAEERLINLSSISPFEFSQLGEFTADSDAMYLMQVQNALKVFVEPEPAVRKVLSGKSTKLTAALRTAFKADRVLALRDEDLSAHRVVSNVELGTGLVADFVLKNGAMHVLETVDASSETGSALRAVKDIALSALTIEQARIAYGESATVGRLIYQASAQTEALASSALQAAEHQRIELVNWSSGDDRRKLLTTIASLAIPLPRKAGGAGPVNASAQGRFEIN